MNEYFHLLLLASDENEEVVVIYLFSDCIFGYLLILRIVFQFSLKLYLVQVNIGNSLTSLNMFLSNNNTFLALRSKLREEALSNSKLVHDVDDEDLKKPDYPAPHQNLYNYKR